MTYDLAFFFCDVGEQWWKTACIEMLRSAKRVMPDARIVQLSPKGTAMHPWAHELVTADLGPDAPPVADILSSLKMYLIAEHVSRTPHNVIICDVDVIWTAKPPMLHGGGCAWDETADALPWRQFYIQSGVDGKRTREWLLNNCKAFLEALPPVTFAKDAAELFLNFNIPKSFGGPAEIRSDESTKYLMHFPGRPEEMIAFARTLDGGEDFKLMDPSYVPPPPEPVKQGVNEDLMSINFAGPEPL